LIYYFITEAAGHSSPGQLEGFSTTLAWQVAFSLADLQFHRKRITIKPIEWLPLRKIHPVAMVFPTHTLNVSNDHEK
jgi:hypothetical protein